MKKPYLVPGLLMLLVGSAAASVVACSPKDSATDPDGAAGADSSNASGGDGSPGSPDGAGGSDGPGAAGEGGTAGGGDGSAGSPDGAGGSAGPGAAGEGGTANGGGAANGGDGAGEAGSGSQGEAGAAGASNAGDALPATTFLYVYSQTADHDQLIARDFITGEERVVTDLRGDGSDGWEIWGHAISPDRTRIALASLYAPTDADIATGLATRRVFTLGTDGGDFQRLTPVQPNTGGGRTGFSISIDDPAFSADGSAIIYDMGNWWYEGTSLEGGTQPWYVATSGDELPQLFPSDFNCSILTPSVNPVTGDILLIHSVCVSSDDEGIFLYPVAGGAPTKLVDKGYGGGAVNPALEKASWLGDGSGFLFVATREVTQNDNTVTVSSLVIYDMTSKVSTPLFDAAPDTYMRSATIAPDGSGIVYCLSHDGGLDLHAIDLTLDPAEDVAITNDGKSCDPGF